MFQGFGVQGKSYKGLPPIELTTFFFWGGANNKWDQLWFNKITVPWKSKTIKMIFPNFG